MLISPAEPASLRQLGKVSSTPERYGVDFLFYSPVFGAVGIQRKEIKDLVASVHDGRLQKEMGQMRALGMAVLLVEGRVQWTNEDLLMNSRSKWTRSQHFGLMWSVRLQGYWTDSSTSLTDTTTWLSMFQRWANREHHGSLTQRPGPSTYNEWGRADNRDWGIHLLQGFPGIGHDTAGNIYDHFGGVPLTWGVSDKELQSVRGVGKKRAERLVAALDHQFEWVELEDA